MVITTPQELYDQTIKPLLNYDKLTLNQPKHAIQTIRRHLAMFLPGHTPPIMRKISIYAQLKKEVVPKDKEKLTAYLKRLEEFCITTQKNLNTLYKQGFEEAVVWQAGNIPGNTVMKVTFKPKPGELDRILNDILTILNSYSAKELTGVQKPSSPPRLH